MTTYGRDWRRVRRQVLFDEGFRCALCGGHADQVDHIVALVDGGSRLERSNLQAACRRCNVAKENERRLSRVLVGRRVW